MRIERTERGDLVVTNRETFLRVLLLACVAVIVLVWLTPVPLRQAIAWSAVCLIFGLALLAADEQSRFVFDSARGMLTWRKDTVFRHDAGETPFASITALSLERDFARSGQRGSARRLVVLTTEGPIPVTSAFSGLGRTQERVGRDIQQFLGERSPPRSIPFVTD